MAGLGHNKKFTNLTAAEFRKLVEQHGFDIMGEFD
jgi:hypothetical protein